jgi:hypothetical protein
MLRSLSNIAQRARLKAMTNVSFAAHGAFHWYARRSLRLQPRGAAATAEFLRDHGYAVIQPDPRVSEFVQAAYKEMAAAWTASDRTWRDPPTGGTYKIFLSDVCERWPQTLELIDGATGSMLESYYGCHYRYSYVEPYRTLPAEGELPKSWLWHRDAVPPGVLKLMVYLNGANGETGALRVLDREQSRALDRLGYESRKDSEKYRAEFEKRHVVLEGGPGTAVIIDNSVLHKATAPEHGYRDVICFQILPSLVPEHIARERSGASRSYRRDTPQHPVLPVGY